MREIDAAAKRGNDRAILSLKMFDYRVKKYIGSYAAAMGGVDIIVFTGGIGENDVDIREKVCEDMEFLGVELDKAKNAKTRGIESVISKKKSRVSVLVVPTNEELVIGQETVKVLEKTI